MLKVVQEDSKSSNEAASAGGPLLDALVREGARQMLATALQVEVAAYVDAHADRQQFRQPERVGSDQRTGFRRLDGMRSARPRGLRWPVRRRDGQPATASADHAP